MSGAAVADKVLDEFSQTGTTLITTNLSKEQEDKLREAFAEAEEQTDTQAPQPV